jgi:hypothetical protein
MTRTDTPSYCLETKLVSEVFSTASDSGHHQPKIEAPTSRLNFFTDDSGTGALDGDEGGNLDVRRRSKTIEWQWR